MLPHKRLEIRPRRKDPFAPEIFPAVDEAVQDFHAKVGHADLIGIRKAKGKPHVHVLNFLDNAAHFSPDILRRLLHLQQKRFDLR